MMAKRERMVHEIKQKYNFDSPQVMSVMLQVPRHEFVPEDKIELAYGDHAAYIGYGQTISQPYTVAYMTHLLLQGSKPCNKVLEIGTGSGYQAAILSKLFKKVYTVEIVPELAQHAKSLLAKLGYGNVNVKEGSGEWGWEEYAPYDAIMVTAGIADEVPQELFEQLKPGGVLVAPIGSKNHQVMTRSTKINKRGKEKLKKEEFGRFSFVPFVKEV